MRTLPRRGCMIGGRVGPRSVRRLKWSIERTKASRGLDGIIKGGTATVLRPYRHKNSKGMPHRSAKHPLCSYRVAFYRRESPPGFWPRIVPLHVLLLSVLRLQREEPPSGNVEAFNNTSFGIGLQLLLKNIGTPP
jgi:hypothetical protein